VAFEASWSVLLTSGGEHTASTAVIHPQHLATRPGAFPGDGAFVTLQVAEAGLEYERVIGPGLRCDLPLPDEPRGQRRFGITDPAGAWIDVVEQIQPEDGWWDPYLREQA
jgi:hypothetical protein